MESLQVESVTIEELSILHRIGKETFIETFADSNNEADLHKYIEERFHSGTTICSKKYCYENCHL